jgi:hypothetical protein
VKPAMRKLLQEILRWQKDVDSAAIQTVSRDDADRSDERALLVEAIQQGLLIDCLVVTPKGKKALEDNAQ